MSNTAAKISLKDLQSMSHHVGYSILMMRECTSKVSVPDSVSYANIPAYSSTVVCTSESIHPHLTITPQIRRERVTNNVAVECFLLHYRRLYAFLYFDTKSQSGDCIASDFIGPTVDWSSQRPPIGEYLKALNVPINKHLAHLTYDPVWKGKMEWPIPTMNQAIEKAYFAFLYALPLERREWFPNEIQ